MTHKVLEPIVETEIVTRTTYKNGKQQKRREVKRRLLGHKEVHTGTYDECWVYILKHQGNSVSYALRYGDWKIIKG